MESLLVKDVTYSYRNKYQTVHALILKSSKTL